VTAGCSGIHLTKLPELPPVGEGVRVRLFCLLAGLAAGATIGALVVVGWSIRTEIERVTP
jgi:hypothetical protein